jgi:GNAT superfamily N-acetyltransferase
MPEQAANNALRVDQPRPGDDHALRARALGSSESERHRLLFDVLASIQAGPSAPSQQAALVARDRENIVGAAAYRRVADSDEAIAVGLVETPARHHGIGTELMRDLAELADSHGIRYLTVEDDPDGHDSGLTELLRDIGFHAEWDLGRVTRVRLHLGTRRPGWVTPTPADP